MIDKDSILKMAKDVFRKGQGYPDKRLMHPQREWTIGLGIFALIIGVGSFVSFNIYVKYNTIDTQEREMTTRVTSYNEVAAQNALAVFRERQRVFNALTNRDVVIEVVSSGTTTEEVLLPEEESAQGAEMESLGEFAPQFD